jgi:signal peptidase I
MMSRLERFLPVLLAHVAIAALLVAAGQYIEPVRVVGGSMQPAFYSGDLVLVRRGVRASPGEVVLARQPGRAAVLHRFIAEGPDGSIRLKGDANETEDFEPVNRAHLSGRAIAVIPVGALLHRWRHPQSYDTLAAQLNSRL